MAKSRNSLRRNAPEPRTGMPVVQLDERQFRERFLQQFADPRFQDVSGELGRVAAIAFRNCMKPCWRKRRASCKAQAKI